MPVKIRKRAGENVENKLRKKGRLLYLIDDERPEKTISRRFHGSRKFIIDAVGRRGGKRRLKH